MPPHQTLKRFVFLILLMLLLPACTQKDVLIVTLASSPPASRTPATTKTNTATYAYNPKETQAVTNNLTATIAPVSKKTFAPSVTRTVTPYPTFEKSMMTVLPTTRPAQCPIPDPNYVMPTDTFAEPISKPIEEIILNLLNSGASLQYLKNENDRNPSWPVDFVVVDLTGDGTNELFSNYIFTFDVFSCANGKYIHLFHFPYIEGSQGRPRLEFTRDMNLNGIPEIVISTTVTSASDDMVDILEWNGVEFVSMIQANHGRTSRTTSTLAKALYWYGRDLCDPMNESINQPIMNNHARIQLQDIDGNGTIELILSDKGPAHEESLYTFGPWRGKQVIFKWDGFHYLFSSLEMDPPKYLFQAVQDADRYFLIGEYDRALKLYQDVIYSNQYEWWSEARMKYIRDLHYSKTLGFPTPVPPEPDTNEYLYLAAYARYRIMLHHIARGWISDAEVVYETLQNKFHPGTPGADVALMARIFWEDYQETKSLELSCSWVVFFAKGNPPILAALGDFMHGGQSHIYVPEDLCPFPMEK